MTARVGIIMGSDSDLSHMEGCMKTLDEFGIPYTVDIVSAHRTPEQAREYGVQARHRGLQVIIAAAGGAAHLAGVIASLTTLPVIGVPVPSSMNGLDSLLSTVQMPAGVPVATVACGSGGPANAAVLAAQMLGIADGTIEKKLEVYKKKLEEKVTAKNKALRHKLG